MRKYVFIITVFREPVSLILQAVNSVKEHEPRIPITVIADGEIREDLFVPSHIANFKFIQGEHLKKLGVAAKWWKRFIVEGLEQNADYLIKFDPDAKMWRSIRDNPIGNHFGTVQAKYSIRGGCQGITSKLAKTLLDSGILDDPKMSLPETWVSPKNDIKKIDHFKKTNYFSTDMTMEYMTECINEPAIHWSEVKSDWKKVPNNTDLKYAITHPHKE